MLPPRGYQTAAHARPAGRVAARAHYQPKEASAGGQVMGPPVGAGGPRCSHSGNSVEIAREREGDGGAGARVVKHQIV